MLLGATYHTNEASFSKFHIWFYPTKGHKDVALTRSSAEFFLRSQLGIDFLEWLKSGVGFPEEFFFATLVRVSQKLFYQEGIVVQSKYLVKSYFSFFKTKA